MMNGNMHGNGLAYNGVTIRDRDDALNLTDMWKAAGSPDGRAPNDWQSLQQAADFIAYIADTTGKSGNNLIHTKVGRGGGTWAHWQIGMAYAKYLSPEFHAWCNGIVRSYMEGKLAAGPSLAERRVRVLERNAAIRMVDQVRQAHGPQAAADSLSSIYASVGVRVDLTRSVVQRELNLQNPPANDSKKRGVA